MVAFSRGPSRNLNGRMRHHGESPHASGAGDRRRTTGGAGTLAAAVQDRTGPGAARPDRTGVGRGGERHGRGGPAGHDARNGGQVAPAVHREGMRRPSGRAEAGRPAHGQRRGCRTGGDDDTRVDAAGSHAVEHAVDGEGVRHEFRDGAPDLAGVRPAAAPHGDLQALGRPPVHREGARHRRPVHGPAGAGGRALRGREVADPGARPHAADASAASRGRPPARPTTTSATAPPRSSPPSTSPRAKSSGDATRATGPSSSGSSSPSSRRRCRRNWMSTWSSTTTEPTGPR